MAFVSAEPPLRLTINSPLIVSPSRPFGTLLVILMEAVYSSFEYVEKNALSLGATFLRATVRPSIETYPRSAKLSAYRYRPAAKASLDSANRELQPSIEGADNTVTSNDATPPCVATVVGAATSLALRRPSLIRAGAMAPARSGTGLTAIASAWLEDIAPRGAKRVCSPTSSAPAIANEPIIVRLRRDNSPPAFS